MAKRKVKLEVEVPDDEADQALPAKRPSRLWWLASRLFVLLILLGGLVVAAPSIISATGVWKSILSAAAPEVAGKIEIASLSLAWWSPVEVLGLVVRDDAGQALAEVKSIRTEKTLWGLASSYQDLGLITVTEPKAKVILRPDGTNIEDFVAKLPKPKQEKDPAAPISVSVLVTNGAVEFDDQIAGRQWALDSLHADVAWPAAADQPKGGKVSAALRQIGGLPATSALSEINADFSWQPGAGESPTLGAGHAQLKLGGLPTEIVAGALRRFVGDIRPAGALALDVALQWTDDGKSAQVTLRQLAAPQLTLAAPAFLQTDELRLSLTSGTADVLLAGGNLDIKQLKLESNLVELAGSGSAALEALTAGDLQAVAGGRSRAEITGQINLAELARQLPATLHLKAGTQLADGRVQLSLVSQAIPAGGLRWQGWLKTDRLHGTAAGRPIAFNQPLEIDFTLGQTDRGWGLDRLAGSSSFFRLEGSGTLENGSLSGDVDLNRLAAELGQFIDWGESRLAGTLDARVRWQAGQGSAWAGNADAHVRNFEFAAAGLAPWRETDLAIVAAAQGKLAPATPEVAAPGLAELSSASLTISAGPDQLEATLTEPVAKPTAQSQWPVRARLVGDLANWLPRLQPFVPLSGWRAAGSINLQTAGHFSAGQSQLGPTKLEIENLAADGPNLSIREPLVKLDTAGQWNGETHTLTLPSTTLATTSVALRADNIHVVAGAEPSVTGLVDFRADLGKLSSWIGAADVPRVWQITGQPTGRMEIRYQGQTLAADWQAEVENLQYLSLDPPPQMAQASLAGASAAQPRWVVRWTEPRVSLAGQAGYDPVAAKLNLTRANLTSALVSLSAAGTISELTSRGIANLQGEIAYDLKLIENKLKSELFARGPGDDPMKLRAIDTLVLSGQEKRPFVLQGPLFGQPALVASSGVPAAAAPLVSKDLTGEASLGWQGAQMVGLVAGPADFRARLEQGIVNIGPLDIPVSEGRLTTAPRILLTAAQPAVIVERGPMIQNVRISPEMCNLWLKYVAPLVAEATEAEGKFSLGLEGANVPLAAPKRADVAGALAIHGAQVGPGPLAKQYLGIIKQLRTFLKPTEAANPASGTNPAASADAYGRWLVLPEQTVQFAVRDGIAYHDGLTMTNGEFEIKTKGSVRIEDQAISLVASIPIRESWFKEKEKTPLLASLAGKTIEIPIEGTLSSPRPDGKVLENLGKQLASKAVGGLIDKGKDKIKGFLDKELGNGLKGLFGPQTPAAPAIPGLPQER
ncbi:MAG: hypothetical protein SFU86_02370 [Pirellulaceae bacterium]|nr:hypothetical protein [Pirellulaceae bacterium]